MAKATADLALNCIFARGLEREQLDRAGYRPTAEDFELAKTALAWAREKFGAIPAEARSEFEHNMVVALKGDTVGRKASGFAAYAVAAYLKEQDRLFKEKLEAQLGATSTYIGVEKEEVSLKLTVLEDVKPQDTDFGTSYKVKFIDDKGNRLVWWASRPPQVTDDATGETRDAVKGDVLNVVGKVKAHKEFRGIKETTLTRCSVLTMVELIALEEKRMKKADAARRKAERAEKKALKEAADALKNA